MFIEESELPRAPFGWDNFRRAWKREKGKYEKK